MKRKTKDWLNYYTLNLNSFHYAAFLISLMVLFVTTPINMICENKPVWIDSVYTLFDNTIIIPMLSGTIGCALTERVCIPTFGKYISISIAIFVYFILGVLYGDAITEVCIGIVTCIIFYYTHSLVYVIFLHSFAKSLECMVGICYMQWNNIEIDKTFLFISIIICVTILIVQFIKLKNKILE